mmetsp:Transcript_65947/g.189764  ORF Transcript_65947/g.189764 Transcript_65947/m.189764 type:complete len:81 (-) Transcript_65947:411-653(-)
MLFPVHVFMSTTPTADVDAQRKIAPPSLEDDRVHLGCKVVVSAFKKRSVHKDPSFPLCERAFTRFEPRKATKATIKALRK